MIERRRKQTQNNYNLEALQLLVPIVMLLRRSGVPDATLNRCFVTAVSRARHSPSTIRVQRTGAYYQRGAITDLWIRHPAYTNAAGKPLDLPFRGKISLTSLTKLAGVVEAPAAILEMLLKFRTIKKTQKRTYRLIKRYMNYKGPDVLAFEPNHQFLVDAISAATRCMAKNAGRKHSLFWLNAEHKFIPSNYVGEFLKYVHSKGVVFQHEINDWLDEHATTELGRRHNRHNVRRVGVGLFPISTE